MPMLYSFTKDKTKFFKALLPIVVILHHIANSTNGTTDIAQWINVFPVTDIAICIFFAISGYGLVYSYNHKPGYLDGFLKTHFFKLFGSYCVTASIFAISKFIFGIDFCEGVVLSAPTNLLDMVMTFVPATWFLFVLFLFYIFFYISFSLKKLSLVQKIVLTSLFITVYYLAGYITGWSPWRWYRTPAFVVGMFAAYFEPYLIDRYRIIHILLLCAVCISLHYIVGVVSPSVTYFSNPVYCSILFFGIMLCIRPIPRLKLVEFLSRYSLEMYVVQGIPLYLTLILSQNHSRFFCLVFLLFSDLLIAICIHWICVLLNRVMSKKLLVLFARWCYQWVRPKPSYYHKVNSTGIVEAEAGQPRLIVSLTSFPARIKTVRYTIESLLLQNRKPNMVVLWLGYDKFPSREKDLPKCLTRLTQYGLTIKWCKDIKSYTKLIPTLEEYPDDIIVTVDDDVWYPPQWLDNLYKSYESDPKAIHADRVMEVTFSDGKINPYADWKFNIYGPQRPSYLWHFTGTGGVLYPPHCLHKDVTDRKFLTIAPTVDDIWFWSMAILNGTKVKVIANNIYAFEGVFIVNNVSLWSSNVDNRNDIALEKIVKEYPEIEQRIINEYSQAIN